MIIENASFKPPFARWVVTMIFVVTFCAISVATGLHASQIAPSTKFNQTAKPQNGNFSALKMIPGVEHEQSLPINSVAPNFTSLGSFPSADSTGGRVKRHFIPL